MVYNWNKMVTITVPVGLNGWVTRGRVIINGREFTFPIGVETQVPEPVADHIRKLQKMEEDGKPTLPPSGCVDTEARQQITALTEEIHNLSWEDLGQGESVETTIVDNVTVTVIKADGIYYGTIEPAFEPLISGETYTVVWNGVEYICVAYDSNGVGVVGLNLTTGENSECPFAVMSDGQQAMCVALAAGPHTLTIRGKVQEIMPVPEKYLPAQYMKVISLPGKVDPGELKSALSEMYFGKTDVIWNDQKIADGIVNTSLKYALIKFESATNFELSIRDGISERYGKFTWTDEDPYIYSGVCKTIDVQVGDYKEKDYTYTKTLTLALSSTDGRIMGVPTPDFVVGESYPFTITAGGNLAGSVSEYKPQTHSVEAVCNKNANGNITFDFTDLYLFASEDGSNAYAKLESVTFYGSYVYVRVTGTTYSAVVSASVTIDIGEVPTRAGAYQNIVLWSTTGNKRFRIYVDDTGNLVTYEVPE